jgi:hypothetical protein
VHCTVWVQQDVSGVDTADTAHIGIHVSQRQGFLSSKGWSQLCGDGRGPRAKIRIRWDPKARDRSSATAIQSIGFH